MLSVWNDKFVCFILGLEKDIQLIERHDHIFVADTCKSFYLA